MGEWKRLRRKGKSFGGFGVPIVNPFGIDPYLEEVDFQTKTRVATGFAGRVWKGSHGHRKQVQVGTVCAALVGAKEKIALETGRQPLHQPRSKNPTDPTHAQRF